MSELSCQGSEDSVTIFRLFANSMFTNLIGLQTSFWKFFKIVFACFSTHFSEFIIGKIEIWPSEYKLWTALAVSLIDNFFRLIYRIIKRISKSRWDKFYPLMPQSLPLVLAGSFKIRLLSSISAKAATHPHNFEYK